MTNAPSQHFPGWRSRAKVGERPRDYVGTKIGDLATVFAVASVERADWFNPSIAHKRLRSSKTIPSLAI